MTLSKKWVPHNYQLTAISAVLDNLKFGLFLDPGLGKTSIILITIKILTLIKQIKSTLIIAPLRPVYGVWPKEIKKWLNFNNISYTILHEKTKASLWGKQKDIYLINPEGLPWLFKELAKGLKTKSCPFNTLVVDESTKFKSHLSKRFELIVAMLPLFKRRYIMTGTPTPHSLLDIWSQMYIIDEGEALGKNFYKYRNEHFYTNDWNKYNWILKPGHAEIIQKKIASKILDMSSEDYLDLPPIVYNDIEINLPEKALKLYKQMEREFFIEYDMLESSAKSRVVASMKCHQIANGSVYEDIPEELDEEERKIFKKTRKTIFVHKAKIEALQDLIDELNGKSLLVAYYYAHDLEALRKLLGKDVPYIGGGVSASEGEKIEDLWNAGKIPVLLAHPDSMSHGLNLQGNKYGHDIAWFSLTWNLENYMQFIRRIWRQGIIGIVRVHHFVAKGTTDIAMLSRLGHRSKNQIDFREAIRKYRKIKGKN